MLFLQQHSWWWSWSWNTRTTSATVIFGCIIQQLEVEVRTTTTFATNIVDIQVVFLLLHQQLSWKVAIVCRLALLRIFLLIVIIITYTTLFFIDFSSIRTSWMKKKLYKSNNMYYAFFYCSEIYCSQNDYQNEQDDCIFLLDLGLHDIMTFIEEDFWWYSFD